MWLLQTFVSETTRFGWADMNDITTTKYLLFFGRLILSRFPGRLSIVETTILYGVMFMIRKENSGWSRMVKLFTNLTDRQFLI